MRFVNRDFNIIAGMLADKAGVKILPGSGWRSNPKEKIIYYPENEPITAASIGYLIHEAAHLRFTTLSRDDVFEKFGETNKSKQQLFMLYNALEDVRVDKEITKLYPGAEEYLYEDAAQTYDQVFDTLQKGQWFYAMPEDRERFKNWYETKKWLQFLSYWAYYFHLGKDEANEMANAFMHPEVLQAIKDSHRIMLRVPKCKDSKENLIVLKDVLPTYLPLCDSEEEEKEKEKKTDEEMKQMVEKFKKMLTKIILSAIKKAIKDEEGEEAQEEDEDSQEQIDTEEKTSPEKDTEKPAEEPTTEIKKLNLETGEQETLDKPPEEMTLARITSDKIKEKLDEFFYTNLPEAHLTTEQLAGEVNKRIAQIRKAVSVLKDSEVVRYEGNYESGRLQNKKLYKLKLKTNKIFNRKVALADDNKDMAIALLVDESGSMNGSQSKAACIATTLLAKALEMSNRPFAIYGFNNNFFVHKDWNKKIDYKEMVKIDGNASGDFAGYNNDGWAVYKATKNLLKRSEKNKILIVLSDGEPAPSSGTSEEGKDYHYYDLAEEAKKAEQKIKVYSIGIHTSAVTRYYRRAVVINSLEELAPNLIKFFKENVGKRRV